MKLSANEAAKRTGKSVPTITRAIKSGKISADRTDTGGYIIDPSELFRVFPAVTTSSNTTPNALDPETPKLPLPETSALEEKIRLLEAALSDAKVERDEWRDQAKRLATALPAPSLNSGDDASPVMPPQRPHQPRRWWLWRTKTST